MSPQQDPISRPHPRRRAAYAALAAGAVLVAGALPSAAALAGPTAPLASSSTPTSASLTPPAAVDVSPAAVPADDWLHTDGSTIVDAAGNEVWLTGANWFGFNASERVLHGLWSGNLEAITRSMAERGINIVRVPVSTELLLEWKDGETVASPNVNTFVNPELVGMDNKEIFDHWLSLCEKYGLKVMIDLHSATADNSGHVYPLWTHGGFTVEDFYAGWEWFAQEYADDDTIVAADLKNEPHGSQSETLRAKWDGSSDADNWRFVAEQAAARILAINPHLLILVEGVQVYPKAGKTWADRGLDDFHNTWWGGNLRGAADHPVDLGAHQDQLVYSPHDYGPLVSPQPWFEGDDWDRASLEAEVWDPSWLYLWKQETAPLLVGEWGGFLDGGKNEKWMRALRDMMVDYRISHTFWCLNPNSGDTGGLLNHDWSTWDEAKYDLLEPALWKEGGKFVSLDHQVPLGGAGSTTGQSLGDLYGDGGTTPVPDTQAPTVPGTPSATDVTSSGVTLTWAASTDDRAVTAYDVYRNDATGTTKVATTIAPNATLTGLSAATTYSFTVRARDAAGNVSPASGARTVTTSAGPVTPTGQCAVTFSANGWSTGYTGTLKVTSTGSTPRTRWTLTFTLPAGQQVTNGWSGAFSQSGTAVTVVNAPWNATLSPGASVELGFTANGTGAAPTGFALDGQVCSTS